MTVLTREFISKAGHFSKDDRTEAFLDTVASK